MTLRWADLIGAAPPGADEFVYKRGALPPPDRWDPTRKHLEGRARLARYVIWFAVALGIVMGGLAAAEPTRAALVPLLMPPLFLGVNGYVLGCLRGALARMDDAERRQVPPDRPPWDQPEASASSVAATSSFPS